MVEIAVSVTCYGNEDEVIEFARKLSRQTVSANLVLLITCNKCDDVKKLREALDTVAITSRIITPNENLGYLHGCLYALASLKEEYKWAVITNTDIDFASNDFFACFLQVNYDSRVGCVGPDITLATTGTPQNS